MGLPCVPRAAPGQLRRPLKGPPAPGSPVCPPLQVTAKGEAAGAPEAVVVGVAEVGGEDGELPARLQVCLRPRLRFLIFFLLPMASELALV